MFREQVGTVTAWFDRWSPCEQTVAMVALLRRVPTPQQRLLTAILQKNITECADIRRAEILANDPNYVASLSNLESKDALVRELLAHLPLLSPKSLDVKTMYLNLIPKVLKYTTEHAALLEEARQLLSYSLIHPAFTQEDKALFAAWLHQFEDKPSSSPSSQGEGLISHYPSSCNNSPPNLNGFGNSWQPQQQQQQQRQHSQPLNAPQGGNNNPNNLSGSPASQSGLSLGNFVGPMNFHRIRRSNSLTPPVLHSDAWNTQDDLCSGKPRSLSLSSELSPQSSLASSGSGSESHLDDPRPQFVAPGMKDVPGWLKSLRLHKYAYLFAHLTFEEMMSLNEDKLELQTVTKGARHKIILSVQKLQERSQHMKKVFEEMTGDKESIRSALNEVKWTLTTPIKPASLQPLTLPGTGGDGEFKTEPGTSSNVMAPIGTNRFPDENASSAENTNRCVDQLFRRDPPAPSAHGHGNREKETDDDLTGWIIRTIGKACELNPDMELEGLLISVIEKCLSHEAFTGKQKRFLMLWRQQHSPSGRRNSSGGHNTHLHAQHRNNGSPNSGSHSSSKHSRHFSPRVLNFGNQLGGLATVQPSWGSSGNSLQAMFMAKRPSLQDSILESARSHLSVHRTKSAPLPNFFSPLSSSPPSHSNPFEQITSTVPSTQHGSSRLLGHPTGLGGLDLRTNSPPSGLDIQGSSGLSGNNYGLGQSTGSSSAPPCSSAMDITSRLESLCLSMTEAALGPAFSNY